MARVTVEDCLENVDSRFALVQLAVRRVLQLRRGAPQLITSQKNKEVVVALREIAAKQVTLDNIREIEESETMPVVATRGTVEENAARHKEVEEILEVETSYKLDADLEIKDGAEASGAQGEE